jgi:putative ABC transport system ATP-binding protein
MGEPELVLCDEPTGNLDTENAAAVSTLLRSVNAAGTTILMVTHDPDLAATADRVVRITDGVLREA